MYDRKDISKSFQAISLNGWVWLGASTTSIYRKGICMHLIQVRVP